MRPVLGTIKGAYGARDPIKPVGIQSARDLSPNWICCALLSGSNEPWNELADESTPGRAIVSCWSASACRSFGCAKRFAVCVRVLWLRAVRLFALFAGACCSALSVLVLACWLGHAMVNGCDCGDEACRAKASPLTPSSHLAPLPVCVCVAPDCAPDCVAVPCGCNTDFDERCCTDSLEMCTDFLSQTVQLRTDFLASELGTRSLR